MRNLKKIIDRITDSIIIIATVCAAVMLPHWIGIKRPFEAVLNMSVFYIFYDHFFRKGFPRLSDQLYVCQDSFNKKKLSHIAHDMSIVIFDIIIIVSFCFFYKIFIAG